MIELNAWDSDFFGRKIGSARVIASAAEADAMLSEARERGFSYLVMRLTPSDLPAMQMLESRGFYTSDVGIVWQHGLRKTAPPSILARQGTNDDNTIVRQIASGLFRDGRFYRDPFFLREEADRLYSTWAENLLKGDADKVFLIRDEGFIACELSGKTGKIVLVGVSAGHQRKRGGTELVLNALAWFKESGAETVTVRTQAVNKGAIALYEANGFRLKGIDITMGRIVERD